MLVMNAKLFSIHFIWTISSADCNAKAAPVPADVMVKDAIWDFVSKVAFTARDSLEKIERSKLGQEVK